MRIDGINNSCFKFEINFKRTQKALLPILFALSAKDERSSMTEISKQVENSCRPHVQGREL